MSRHDGRDGTGDDDGDPASDGSGERRGFGRGPPGERTPRELLGFGVVNLDKPPGPSAHQVSGWVRDLLVETAAGLPDHEPGDAAEGNEDREAATVDRAAHAGTLDPKVTGCLPVLTGTATRLSEALLTPKEYVTVLEVHKRLPGDFEEIVEEFVGPIYQKPPRKSAVSRRLRVREVYGIEVLDAESRRALLRIGCESGTYVRKLCHDLGLALGTGAHMGDLRRTRAEPFDDSDLVTLQDLADALAVAADGEFDGLEEVVQPAERALTHLPRLVIAHTAARQVAQGAPVYAPGILGHEPPEPPIAAGVKGHGENDGNENEMDRTEGGDDGLVACYTPDGAVVCLGRLVGDPEAERGTVVDTERVLV